HLAAHLIMVTHRQCQFIHLPDDVPDNSIIGISGSNETIYGYRPLPVDVVDGWGRRHQFECSQLAEGYPLSLHIVHVDLVKNGQVRISAARYAKANEVIIVVGLGV